MVLLNMYVCVFSIFEVISECDLYFSYPQSVKIRDVNEFPIKFRKNN